MKIQRWNKDSEPIELLPCPFCGTEPNVKHVGNEYTKSRSLVIKCPKCRTEMKNSAIRFGFEWLENITAKSWNTRASLVLAPEWVSVTVSSEKPEIDEPIWFISYSMIFKGYRDSSGYYTYDGKLKFYQPMVTYWCRRILPPPMPTQSPPKESAND